METDHRHTQVDDILLSVTPEAMFSLTSKALGMRRGRMKRKGQLNPKYSKYYLFLLLMPYFQQLPIFPPSPTGWETWNRAWVTWTQPHLPGWHITNVLTPVVVTRLSFSVRHDDNDATLDSAVL